MSDEESLSWGGGEDAHSQEMKYEDDSGSEVKEMYVDEKMGNKEGGKPEETEGTGSKGVPGNVEFPEGRGEEQKGSTKEGGDQGDNFQPACPIKKWNPKMFDLVVWVEEGNIPLKTLWEKLIIVVDAL